MSERIEFICVTCPMGCAIQATVEGGRLIAVQGQACKRGEAFVREELTAPRRMLTTTVQVCGGRRPLLPVHTSAPLPRSLLLDATAFLRGVCVMAPVAEGQVIVADVLGSGVDMLASRPVEAA